MDILPEVHFLKGGENMKACIDGDHAMYVRKKEFDLFLLLVEELVASLIGKEQFRVVIEKKPDADKLMVEYRF